MGFGLGWQGMKRRGRSRQSPPECPVPAPKMTSDPVPDWARLSAVDCRPPEVSRRPGLIIFHLRQRITDLFSSRLPNFMYLEGQ